jgi:DNA-binding transcriptional regulator YiaG
MVDLTSIRRRHWLSVTQFATALRVQPETVEALERGELSDPGIRAAIERRLRALGLLNGDGTDATT